MPKLKISDLPNSLGYVQCTECVTHLPRDVNRVRMHYLAEHKIDLGKKRLREVFANTECPDGIISTGVVKKSPTEGVKQINDGDRKGRLLGEVQGGGFGTKK